MKVPLTKTIVNQDDEKTIDLRRIFGLIMRYWYLILAIPILAGILASFFTRYMIPQYKITSSILIRNDDKQKKTRQTGAIDASILFSGNSSTLADEIEILKSRTLMKEVLQELKINPVVSVIGRLKSTEFYNNSPIVVDSFYFDENVNSVVVDVIVKNDKNFEISKIVASSDEPIANISNIKSGEFGKPIQIGKTFFTLSKRENTQYDKFQITFKESDNLCIEYLKKLNVSPGKQLEGTGHSNSLILSFEDALPKRGVQVCNKLIEVYNRYGIKDKNSGEEGALKFIDNRIDLLTNEVNSAEKDIELYKNNKGITADVSSDLDYLFNKIGTSDSKIVDLEIQKSMLNSLSITINKQELKNEYELMPVNLIENNSNISNQIIEYNKLLLERDRILKFAKKENPSVVFIESQIKDIRKNIKLNIENTLSNVTLENNIALTKFKTENSVFNQKLRQTPKIQRELVEITRLKNVKESIYLFLLQKREEISLSLATTIANARILDTPISTVKPIKPNKTQIVLGSIFIGLLFSVLLISILVLLNDTVENEDDIREITDTTFLGYITMDKNNENQIVVEKGSRSSTAETFRLLRSNLQFMLASDKNKTIMVTSSMSGEGKSFVTLNLGVSMALSNKKTIILGFDLRKPKLTSYLQNTSDKTDVEGLTNYLIGDISADKVVHKSDVNDMLYYISSGPVPPNPAELIMQERTDALFEYLKDHFDIIIIDTPPVGMVVDALLLAKYASTTLYVTRFGVTKKGQLRIVENLKNEGKLPNTSIVLNAVKSGKGYGYGYGYGYSYGYGYGYGEELSKKRLWFSKLFGNK